MRVTVCELPHETDALAAHWEALCQHTRLNQPDLLLLPELGMVEPFWEAEQFEEPRWERAVANGERWMRRLGELRAGAVVGTRPILAHGHRVNQGFCWTERGVATLRSKHFLPAEPGGWETHWFERGDAGFPTFHAGGAKAALNICTELWALQSYAQYATQGVELILSPRATAAATTSKWLAVGVTAAVRSGAYSISSNRIDPRGNGGGVGWIISPDGDVLCTTSATSPVATMDIDLDVSVKARRSYPRYVFAT